MVRVSSSYDVPPHEVRDLLAGTADAGVDVDRILDRVGARWRMDAVRAGYAPAADFALYSAIARECIFAIEMEATRTTGVEPIRQEEYDLFCQGLVTASTLGAAIERTHRMANILGGRMGVVRLVVENGVAKVEIDAHRGVQTRSTFASELFGLLMYDQIYSWLIGRSLPLNALEMDYPASYADHALISLARRPLSFDHAHAGFRFPAEMLAIPTVRRPEELEALLPLTPYSVRKTQHIPLSDMVLKHFERALITSERLPTLEQLAADFHLSPTTLRRRLAQEGTSLQNLKNASRMCRATRLLHQSLPVSEIASRLGFSDDTAFRRAWRQWTGSSPTGRRSHKPNETD